MKKLGIALVALGSLVLLGVGLFYIFGDSVVSEIRKETSSKIVEVKAPPAPVADSVPAAPAPEPVQVRQYSIAVANSGGEEALDACTGGFTKMDQDGMEGKTIIAAHNNCGGDILLPIVVGDQVVIEGQGTYRVAETRDTEKSIYPSAIVDMKGEILVQTCYYGVQKMKFLALEPVGDTQAQV